jgi:hypothetical protein
MINDKLGELFETLTVEKLFVPARTPPYGGYNPKYYVWQQYWCGNVPGVDIEYRNKEGKLHRIYGPAYLSKNYDVELWYKDGKFHREGGPAVKHRNNFLWYQDGKLHNLNGPAIDVGGEPKQYWINGQKLSPKEYRKEIARRIRKGLIK